MKISSTQNLLGQTSTICSTLLLQSSIYFMSKIYHENEIQI